MGSVSVLDEVLPGDADGVDLPRRQAGTAPQNLLVTLLADYGIRHGARWPSAGLVSLLGEFGVSAPAARATLSRLTRRAVLRVFREGRRTSYQLTPEAVAALTIGGRRIARFAADAESWDGRWTLVAFAGAGDGGNGRRLRTHLRWLGYGCVYDGLWASARADPAFTVAALGDSRPVTLTVFRSREVILPEANRSPLDAWDLTHVAGEYESFVKEWGWLATPRGELVRGGRALVARTRLMDAYRRFPALDPQLPQHLMPPGWPREQARLLFERGYDGLAGHAEARVRDVLTAAGVDVPAGLGHHTVEQLITAPWQTG
jgi:phenylacetic acid degradation operon negative regulatory protein